MLSPPSVHSSLIANLPFTFFGHYRDTVSFYLLHNSLKSSDTVWNAMEFHSISTSIHSSKVGLLVYGSWGGVASDTLEDDYFNIDNRCYESGPYILIGKQTVWTLLSLTATGKLFGREIPTYDIKEVASLAIIWTGLWVSLHWGNYEYLDWSGDNYMDPMSIFL